MSPIKRRVTRSPRQEATGGAMLSGSRPKKRQRTIKTHMKLPRRREERQVAVIDVEATIMNLRVLNPKRKEEWATYVGKPDFRAEVYRGRGGRGVLTETEP